MTAATWTSGYVADVNYTYGYYAELNPLRSRLLLLNQGFLPPTIETACELGFGQGLSVGIHAAASPVQWWGTDFNPAQAAFARELASVSGANARFFDEAFADFVHRGDLPDFDFIALHGIWTWISDENRRVIVDLIRRKLRPGGLVYISYNTQPGWGAFIPMRNLLTKAAAASGGADTIESIELALEFADKLLEVEPIFGKANPNVPERLKRLKEQDKAYLAHEYFNRDWRPMHFSEAAEFLEAGKISYACPANPLEHLDVLNLKPPQIELLQQIQDPHLREDVRDFIVNQQFRRDYWIKGPRRLSPLEQTERLAQERVVLISPRGNVEYKAKATLGDVTLNESIYAPILDVLADYKSKTIGEIAQAVEKAGVTAQQVVEALVILSGDMKITAAQDADVIKAVQPQCDRLNAHIEARARSHTDTIYLASPVTGGGVGVNRFDQLFLLAMRVGIKQPAEWARYAWDLLDAQGQAILKDGSALATPEENLAELNKQASAFAEVVLPVFKGAGLV